MSLVPLVAGPCQGYVLCGCELSMLFGSLHTDVWDCVTLLVVWLAGTYKLLCGARSWYRNGGFQESSYQWTFIGPLLWVSLPSQWATANPNLLGTPKPIVRSSPGYYGATALCWVPVNMRSCLHLLRVEFLFPPILWSSCTQALLAFKDKCSWSSSSWFQTLRLSWRAMFLLDHPCIAHVSLIFLF